MRNTDKKGGACLHACRVLPQPFTSQGCNRKFLKRTVVMLLTSGLISEGVKWYDVGLCRARQQQVCYIQH